MKKFKLSVDQMSPIAIGLGGCTATDRIVVDGMPVGYMYRDAPHEQKDSGWRFFAGDEDDVYMQDNDNHGVYDVNTIANYDSSILEFLNSEAGSAFEKNADGQFLRVIE